MLAACFGFVAYVSLGWQAYAVLCSFLALGSVATKLGKRRKEELRVAEGGGGQRGLSNVLCNGLVPFLIACFGIWLKIPVLGVAYAAAVATAAFDTVGTEIGQWLGRSPVNPLTFRRVAVGTPGAVSWAGTMAGLAAATLVAFISYLTGWLPLASVPVIILGACIGGLSESLLASVLKDRPANADSTLNIFNTLLGAFVGGLLWLSV